MRSIVLIVLATFALSGCVALAELGALGEASVGVEAGAAAAGESVAATDFTLSTNLLEDAGARLGSGTREASLSQAVYDLTDGGQRPAKLNMNGQGQILARGQPLATLEPSGDLVFQDKKIGFMDARDGRLYETLSDGSSKPIGVLRGFVRENGVELLSQSDRTVVRILRSDVVLDVIGIEDGQYLVRLGDGETGLVPASAVQTIAVLAVTQVLAGCPADDHEGAVVRRSGEVVRFKHCEKKDGAYILSTDGGDTIIDAHDVKYVLAGDGVPGVQDDSAKTRLVAEAQNTAAVVNAAPGEQAMNILATTTYLPILEQSRMDYRAGRRPDSERQQIAAQQAEQRPQEQRFQEQRAQEQRPSEQRREPEIQQGQRQAFRPPEFRPRPQFVGGPIPWQQVQQQRSPIMAQQPGFVAPRMPTFQPRAMVPQVVERRGPPSRPN